MPFTYDPALPTARDRVRFLLQDTTNTSQRPNLLDDGEIDWALTIEANIFTAAALCAEALATRFRGLVSKSVGDLSLAYDRGAQTWGTIAERLRARGATHQALSAGGVYEADRAALWADADLLRPEIFADLHRDRRAWPASPRDSSEEWRP